MADNKDTLAVAPDPAETDDGVLRSCCFTCDLHAAQFVVQVVFSLAFFALAAGMLAAHDTANQSLWVGILTLLLGVWLPAPSATPRPVH